MSIRKRQWINGKGEERESWVVDYRDGQGVRRLKTFRKKKLADAFAVTASAEVRDGVHVAESATCTVKEAGDLWMKSGTAEGLERTTLDQRRQHLDLHIVPFIGNMKLSRITGPTVRAFQDQLRDAGRSAAMVKRVTISLGSILADAYGRGLSLRNPVHDLSRGKQRRRALEKRAKARLEVGVDIPTNDEVRTILTAATGRHRPLIITAAFTGMRPSELRGLRWPDVDLAKALVHVRQRADRYNDIGMPKSSAGQRTIPLPPMAVNALKEWKLACPKGKANLVFPNGAGRVEFLQNMTKRTLWPTEMAAGVTIESDQKDAKGNPIRKPKYSGFYALRHWYASWCINRKVDGGLELSPKAVQQRMGHSSIVVTYDTYGHLFPMVDEAKELDAAERRLLAVHAT